MTPAPARTTLSGVCGRTGPDSKILAAYYPSWKIYRGCKPSDLRVSLLSHVHYAFARFTEDGKVHSLDEKADTQLPVDGVKGCLNALKKARQASNPQLKIILTIGGGSGSAHFPAVAADSKKTALFCRSALQMVHEFELDGVDIDWEHPGTPQEGRLFVTLLTTIRQYFPSPKYIVTAALPVGEWCLKNIDLPSLLNQSQFHGNSQPVLDHLMLMAYDFAGPWTNGQSGHHAQLYTPKKPHNAFAKRSINEATRYLVTERGIDPRRIVIGIPAYGRSFLGVKGPGENFSASGVADTTFAYKELPRQNAMEYVDKNLGAASCYGGDGGWISYDNPETVRMKAEFVVKKNLGGIFFWTGSDDRSEEESSLVVAAHSTLSSMRSER